LSASCAGYPVKEVIETARDVTGHPIPARVLPRRPGDGPSLVSDASRARDLLGWEPRIPDLWEIIASAWAWHQSHPQGYTPVEAYPLVAGVSQVARGAQRNLTLR
jgi:UDP-glucose 4-epimerase